MRLRRRLNTVLLQWFLLLVLITGTVWVISFPGIRKNLVDERLLLARTIAHSIDTTISSAVQDLDRLAADLPDTAADLPSRLHAFRLQSPFNEASYILDEHGQTIASDPAGVSPVPTSSLGNHEAVTSLIRKTDAAGRAVIAIVQPFTHDGQTRYLVSELNPTGSLLSTFLKELEPDPTMHIVVIDDRGAVIASHDPAQLFRTLPGATEYGDRIHAHRPLVVEGAPADFEAGSAPEASLTVMAPLRFASWGVIIQQRNSSAFSGIRTISRGLMFTALLLTIMGVLMARTLTRSVVAPIRQLSRQAEGMRGGDLSSEIAVQGDHEIAVLAKTLDEARVRLSSTLSELQDFNETLEEQVAQRTAVIAAQNEQRKVLLRKMLSATEDERRRLARELHDEIAQLLTVIQLSLHSVKIDSPEMTQANQLLVKTQQEVHRIIHDLRPSLLDDLGLAAAMRSFARDHMAQSKVQCTLEIEEGLPPQPEIETVVFRIFQELVTNVLRHAEAEQLSIQLFQRDGRFILDVEDDGRGFDADLKTGRAGVTGMRERAALVNGTLTFDSEPGMGTHVVLEIPFK
ncbi:MAG: ATP-binding protein [Acidobacteriota bacterium]